MEQYGSAAAHCDAGGRADPGFAEACHGASAAAEGVIPCTAALPEAGEINSGGKIAAGTRQYNAANRVILSCRLKGLAEGFPERVVDRVFLFGTVQGQQPHTAVIRSQQRVGHDSAVEVCQVAQGRPIGVAPVREVFRVLIAKGDAEQQPVAGIDIEHLTHLACQKTQRGLRAAGQPVGDHREHQRLRVHAEIAGFAQAERFRQKQKRHVRRIEEGEITHKRDVALVLLLLLHSGHKSDFYCPGRR